MHGKTQGNQEMTESCLSKCLQLPIFTKKTKKTKHYCPKNDFNISLFTIYVPKTLEGVEGVDGAALVAKRPGSRLESGKLGLDASGL